MKAIVYKGPKMLEVVEIDKPIPKEGQVLVKVNRAGICGGDLGIYKGTHPRAKAPLVFGHEFSGVVEEDGKIFKKGTKVTVNPIYSCGDCVPCNSGDQHVCNTLRLVGIDRDGAMSEYVVVDENKLYELGDEMSDELGALIEPIAVAVHSVREPGYKPGDNAVVFGGGPIGLAIAFVLKKFGCTNLTIIEADDKRIAMGKDFGFDLRDAKGLDLEALKAEKTGGNGFDFVFDCAGVEPVAAQLIKASKVRGKIVIVAGYKTPTMFPVNEGMFKEVAFEFVRVYRDKDYEIAVELAKDEPMFEKLVTHVLPVEQAQEGFDLLLTPGTGAMKVLFKF
ncbi:zinc-dependent alcohol dehydrogenase [Candidatus Epulonipiscium viviparus]|uniref:zinc-dependent alcohol dehydrogenase n=1 Tax=Candidatus Epulonipiscium viviparus TaxID=420336 RepID=UPI00016BFB4E|nr:alcohol dehydrogenase catalytic domain-containing protein [Candidatus Epulopiscium viviparus]